MATTAHLCSHPLHIFSSRKTPPKVLEKIWGSLFFFSTSSACSARLLKNSKASWRSRNTRQQENRKVTWHNQSQWSPPYIALSITILTHPPHPPTPHPPAPHPSPPSSTYSPPLPTLTHLLPTLIHLLPTLTHLLPTPPHPHPPTPHPSPASPAVLVCSLVVPKV